MLPEWHSIFNVYLACVNGDAEVSIVMYEYCVRIHEHIQAVWLLSHDFPSSNVLCMRASSRKRVYRPLNAAENFISLNLLTSWLSQPGHIKMSNICTTRSPVFCLLIYVFTFEQRVVSQPTEASVDECNCEATSCFALIKDLQNQLKEMSKPSNTGQFIHCYN